MIHCNEFYIIYTLHNNTIRVFVLNVTKNENPQNFTYKIYKWTVYDLDFAKHTQTHTPTTWND